MSKVFIHFVDSLGDDGRAAMQLPVVPFPTEVAQPGAIAMALGASSTASPVRVPEAIAGRAVRAIAVDPVADGWLAIGGASVAAVRDAPSIRLVAGRKEYLGLRAKDLRDGVYLAVIAA